MLPDRLNMGDEIRIISPAGTLRRVSEENINFAVKRLKELGFRVTFGKNVYEQNEFNSSSIESRLDDLYDAFEDKNVKAILASIGGYNSNQLLKYINFDIISRNPKIFCGFSDITVLVNAIYAKTGIITYLGPNFSSFAEQCFFDYTQEYFLKAVTSSEPICIESSEYFTDDKWFLNQNDRNQIKNDGMYFINEGDAKGKIIGGNLCSLNLLQGTEYMPDLSDAILFLEDDDLTGESFLLEFDRNLESLIQQKDFYKVKGIVLGRNQINSKVEKEKLVKIIKQKKELKKIPVIADVDFGHTQPLLTLPIGAECLIKNKEIRILQ